MADEVIIVRQQWATRAQPMTAIMGCLVLWLRVLELAHGWFAGMITILGLALIASPLRRVFREARQRLILSGDQLTYRIGGKDTNCRWGQIKQLRRTSPDYAGKGEHGIMVVCDDGRSVGLNGSWTMPRENLLSLLAERCQTSPEADQPCISGKDLRFEPSKKMLKLALITPVVGVFLPLLMFVILAALFGRHH